MSSLLSLSDSIIFPKHLISAINDYQGQGPYYSSGYRSILEYLLQQTVSSTLSLYHQVHLYQLSNDTLEAVLISPESLNHHLHVQLQRLISALLTPTSEEVMTQRERVTEWFQEMHFSKGPSHSYYAKVVPDIFLLKTAEGSMYDTLLYEAVVGMIVVNNVRTYVPNFLYTYGYFQCSPLLPLNESKGSASWCALDSERESSYLILENIPYSANPHTFFIRSDFTSVDLTAVLYQLFNALHVAYHLWGYTHNNISDRWFIRELPEEIIVPYYGLDLKPRRWIKTRFIPYIFEYGSSSFTIGGLFLPAPHVYIGDREELHLRDIESVITSARTLVDEHYPNDASFREVVDSLETFFSTSREENSLHVEFTAEAFFRFAETTLPPPIIRRLPKRGTSFVSYQTPLTDKDFYARFGTSKPITAVAYCQTLQAAQALSKKEYQRIRTELSSFFAFGSFGYNFYPRAQEALQSTFHYLDESGPFPSFEGVEWDNVDKDQLKAYRERLALSAAMAQRLSSLATQLKAYVWSFQEQKVDVSLYDSQYHSLSGAIAYGQARLAQEQKLSLDNIEYARGSVRESFFLQNNLR